jgi:hypothetical protein
MPLCCTLNTGARLFVSRTLIFPPGEDVAFGLLSRCILAVMDEFGFERTLTQMYNVLEKLKGIESASLCPCSPPTKNASRIRN